jgi:O-methyltransferase
MTTTTLTGGAPSQRWQWARPIIPKRLQPYLRGLRKRLQFKKAELLPEPLRTVYPYTQVSRVRQENLLRLCDEIEKNQIPGACIECGVLDGGTGALAAYATRGSGRPIHLFDAWEGLPASTAEDGDDARKWEGEVVGSPRRVRAVLDKLKIDGSRVKFHRGWFHETFPHANISKIALAHIDADFYEATKLCLERWYPFITPGGFMQFDDYDSFQGCHKAVDEFLAAHPELILKIVGPLKSKAYYFQKPL